MGACIELRRDYSSQDVRVQTKLSIFLGAYTIIGFAVGLILLVKNLDEHTGFTDFIVLGASGIWAIVMLLVWGVTGIL